MTKPRTESSLPVGRELARRLEALAAAPRFADRGPEALADALGVSMATLYRWKEGATVRVSRAGSRALLALEGEVKEGRAR